MWKQRGRANVLPLSDNDNAHEKQKRTMSSFPVRWSRVIIVVVGLIVLLTLLAGSQGRLPVKLPNNPSSGHAAAEVGANSCSGQSPLECTRSFDGKRPIEQYVVMIDAGSSGSRVHVYKFNNCQAMPRLVDEKFKMIDGGLSSYPDDPEGAATSLDVLLQEAVNYVPENQRGCTPIAVKATAGLRKLGEEKSKLILDAVNTHLQHNYPFPIVKDGVAIMPGEEEGVHAWVTANYLLGNIGTSEKQPTVAVFDLGGGSTQIVFEPQYQDANKKMSDGDHAYALSFGGRDFLLYQHSYLGYGLNEARSKINTLVAESQLAENPDTTKPLVHPCLPPGTSKEFEVEMRDGTTTQSGPGKVTKKIKFTGPSKSASLQCRGFAERILEKDAICANPPCSFNGVYQPPLFEAFPRDSNMYVFSFFYDRTFPLGMPSTFTLDELRDLHAKVCEGEQAYSAFEAVSGAIPALQEHPDWCMDLSYMLTLLRTGYDLHGSREVRIAKKIDNKELGWCLGASLPLLDGVDWSCRELNA